MRWNCPHCRTALEASDDQIGANWLFTLCPQCMRFGLLRASSQSAVKVDRAPAEEEFVRATVAEPVTAPIVRRAQPRSREQTQIISGTQPQILAPAKPAAPAPIQTQAPAALAQQQSKPAPSVRLPEPLPEVPEPRRAILPRLVLLGCLGILAWNGYRYVAITDNNREVNVARELSDRVVAKAMAPIHIDVGAEVQARGERMQIRNGPGLQFPVIGELAPSKRYKVLSSEDPWFQLQAGTQTPAWVMSDEIVPAKHTL